MCSTCCPGTRSADPAGLELMEIHLRLSPKLVLGLKA